MNKTELENYLVEILGDIMMKTGGERVMTIYNCAPDSTESLEINLHFTTRTVFINGVPAITPLKNDICWRRDFKERWPEFFSALCSDPEFEYFGETRPIVYVYLVWAEKVFFEIGKRWE